MSKSLKYLRKAGPERPAESDRRWQLDENSDRHPEHRTRETSGRSSSELLGLTSGRPFQR
jgi:hypothetical protein